MAIVKLDALNALAAAIATAVPALAGKVVVQQAVSSKIESWPNLSISLAGKMEFNPADRLLQQDLGNNVVVWNVGAHEGPLQMRLVATSSRERMDLEQQVIDFAMARDLGPGVIVVPVVSAAVINWTAAFEYEDSQWQDVRAIEREYDAVLTFNAVIPALVTQSPVYDINKLFLGLTDDMTSTVTAQSFTTDPSIAVVSINQDGTLSPAT